MLIVLLARYTGTALIILLDYTIDEVLERVFTVDRRVDGGA